MVNYCLTNKIFKRLKRVSEAVSLPGTNLLGDWYVNLVIIDRQQILLFVSSRTLLPVLIPARMIDFFPERFCIALEQMLKSLSIPDLQIRRELSSMTTWRLATTNSRQVLGSMNDFAGMLKFKFDRDLTLLAQAINLAETPSGPLEMNTPIEETIKIFSAT